MLLNLLQPTLSLPFNHKLSSFFFFFATFLTLSNFPSRLLPLLFSRHFPYFTISLAFLLGLCCPRGVWDRLGDSLYVPLSWPELPSWGSFDGVGDYSSCSLGCIPLSHSSSSNSSIYIYRHTHTDTLLKNNCTNISYSGNVIFPHCHSLMWSCCCYLDTVHIKH